MSAPLVVNTTDGTVWVLHTVTSSGLALYAVAGACSCPSYLLATLAELAEHGITGRADVLPVPVGPEPRTLDVVEEELTGVNLSLYEEELETARLRLALKSAQRGRRELRARIAELEAERHAANEALDDAAKALRADRDRIAELEAERPSRFTATPAQVDAYLRTILAEDTYLRFQQAIGEHALGEVVEDAQTVRASADNDGLYNADWREGWDDVIERVDPDLCGPAPSKLVEFPAEGPSVAESADRLTRVFAPSQALREDPHDSPLSHPYRLGRDLPQAGDAR